MLSLGFVVLFIGAVAAGPPVSRSRQEIEDFKTFLENVRRDDGTLEERMATNPLAKPWENSGKFQGDILLDDDQAEALLQDFSLGKNAYIWPNTKWPSNTIVYEFGAGEFDRAQEDAIRVAMREIERNTCVRFRARRAGEFNYVRITGRSDGCYAHVGYWASRGVHTLNLARDRPGRGCMIHTIIIHEWLHILGFFHMQSTYNRDNYLRIMWENIIRGMEFNFYKYETNIVNNLGLPYEYASNMHYGPYGFTSNGRPTMVGLYDWRNEMGQLDFVTRYDWLRANRHYNCPGAWRSATDDEGEQVINEENHDDTVNEA